jgi:hypothetical protein
MKLIIACLQDLEGGDQIADIIEHADADEGDEDDIGGALISSVVKLCL